MTLAIVHLLSPPFKIRKLAHAINRDFLSFKISFLQLKKKKQKKNYVDIAWASFRNVFNKYESCLIRFKRKTIRLWNEVLNIAEPSGKHACVMYTPLYPTFILQNWGMQGYTNFSYFALKHSLWVLVRTASHK